MREQRSCPSVSGFLQASGPIVTVFSLSCIVPLAIVVSVLLFIDRFEPETLGMKLAALAGGGVSIFFGIMYEFVQYSVTEQIATEVQE